METSPVFIRDLVRDALASDPSAVINIVGPIGIGKTTLLGDAFPDDRAMIDLSAPGSSDHLHRALLSTAETLVVVDGVDTPRAAEAVADELRTGGRRPLVVAGRLPLRSLPDWCGAVDPVCAVLPAWTDSAIGDLAMARHVDDPPARDLVVRLSGGIPLIATSLCRALHAGVPAEVSGAVADHAVTSILGRLVNECPEQSPDVPFSALQTLATVGDSDAELFRELVAGPDLFPVLGRLSLTIRTELGVGVAEPYRTLLDEAFAWREPIARQTALTRAGAHRRRLLDTTRDLGRRRSLIHRSVFLCGDRIVRDTLFNPATAPAVFRTAEPGDSDDIGRMVDAWARGAELDPKVAADILDGWLRSVPDELLLATTPDGKPVGLATQIPITDDSIACMEPLLQQHTTHATDPENGQGGGRGIFVGVTFCDSRHPAIHSMLLRNLLSAALEHGRMVVSTPWPRYQQLVRSLGFTYLGDTVDDVYNCGRPCQIYTHSFAPQHVGGWLEHLARTGVGGSLVADVGRLTRQLRSALEHLHDPAVLARSPLLAVTGAPTAEALRDRLCAAITALASAHDRLDAEAGRTLHHCYVRNRGGRHDHVARQLHHSRATHFRRLQHGLTILTTRLLRPATDG